MVSTTDICRRMVVYNCRLLKLKVKKKTAELSWWELIHFIVLLRVRVKPN